MLWREGHHLAAAVRGHPGAPRRPLREPPDVGPQGGETVFKHDDVVVRRRDFRGIVRGAGAQRALVRGRKMRPGLPVRGNGHPLAGEGIEAQFAGGRPFAERTTVRERPRSGPPRSGVAALGARIIKVIELPAVGEGALGDAVGAHPIIRSDFGNFRQSPAVYGRTRVGYRGAHGLPSFPLRRKPAAASPSAAGGRDTSARRFATGRQYELRRGDAAGRRHRARSRACGSTAARGVQLTESYGDDEIPPGATGITLAPWSNRVEDGVWYLDGKKQQLDITEVSRNNASHGLLRNSAYDLVDESEFSVTLEAGSVSAARLPVPAAAPGALRAGRRPGARGPPDPDQRLPGSGPVRPRRAPVPAAGRAFRARNSR